MLYVFNTFFGDLQNNQLDFSAHLLALSFSLPLSTHLGFSGFDFVNSFFLQTTRSQRPD